MAAQDTPLGGAGAATGMTQLTGLLGGFALAVGGLLALAGTGVARPVAVSRATVSPSLPAR